MRNKLLTKIAAISLGLAMAIGVSVGVANNRNTKAVYADGGTYTFSDNYNSNTVLDGEAITLFTGVTATFNKRNGGTATQYYTNGTAVRWYGGGTLTIDAGSSTITDISLSFTQTANTITTNVGNYSLSNSVGSWSGSSSAVTFSQSGTSGHCRISAITIAYSTGSGNSPTLESIAISGSMTKTTYTTAENWDSTGLVVTGTYDNDDTANLTGSAEFTYYSDSAMANAVATPNALGTGTNSIYIKATVSGISNGTGFEQTVTVNAVTYSVTYHDTNKTSGSVPTDNNTYLNGASVTVLGNTGSLARTGYTWSGWSLNENGSGTAYGPTYTTTYNVTSSNVDFYPIWVKDVVPLPESGSFSITGSNPAIGAYGSDVPYVVAEDATPDSEFGFNCTNVMKNSNNLQFKKESQGAGTLYSTTPLYYLRSVVVSGANNSDAVITYGKSQNDGCTSDLIGTDNTYFKVTNGADGARYWTITVTYSLSEPELTGLRIFDGLESARKNYDAGESFDPTGLVIQAQWDGEWDTAHNLVNSVVWSPDPLTEGTTSVTGTYSAGGNSETVTVTGLTVVAPDYVVDGNLNKPANVSDTTNTTVGEGLSNGIRYGYYALQTYSTNLEFNQNTLNAYLGNNESYGKYISRIKVTLSAAVSFDRLTMYKGDVAIPGTTVVSPSTNSGTVRSYNLNNDSEYFALKQTTTGNWNQIVKIEVFLGSEVPVVNSISATMADRTYYAGTTLSSSDFDVTISWTAGKADTHPAEGFTWTVNGVANGALVTGSNTVVVTYEGVSTNPALNVVAQASDPKDIVRNNLTTSTDLSYHYSKTANTVTDSLNRATTGITGNNYTAWSNKTGTSSAKYAGQSAGGNESIQLRATSPSAIISTTSGGKINRVSVSWNTNTAEGRTLNVYGKGSAYSASSELYSTNTQGTLLGTIVKGTSTELIIDGDYDYVGVVSASGAMQNNQMNW